MGIRSRMKSAVNDWASRNSDKIGIAITEAIVGGLLLILTGYLAWIGVVSGNALARKDYEKDQRGLRAEVIDLRKDMNEKFDNMNEKANDKFNKIHEEFRDLRELILKRLPPNDQTPSKKP